LTTIASNNNFKYNEAPGKNGRYQILNWKREVIWDYTFVDPEYWPYHDIEPVYHTNERKEKPTFLIPSYTKCGDRIAELKLTGKTTAEVIWDWSGSDHICQSGTKDFK
jgi:hypothetical protein